MFSKDEIKEYIDFTRLTVCILWVIILILWIVQSLGYIWLVIVGSTANEIGKNIISTSCFILVTLLIAPLSGFVFSQISFLEISFTKIGEEVIRSRKIRLSQSEEEELRIMPMNYLLPYFCSGQGIDLKLEELSFSCSGIWWLQKLSTKKPRFLYEYTFFIQVMFFCIPVVGWLLFRIALLFAVDSPEAFFSFYFIDGIFILGLIFSYFSALSSFSGGEDNPSGRRVQGEERTFRRSLAETSYGLEQKLKGDPPNIREIWDALDFNWINNQTSARIPWLESSGKRFEQYKSR